MYCCVILDKKKLIGIMTLGDLTVETRDDKLSGDALEDISEPVHPKLQPQTTEATP